MTFKKTGIYSPFELGELLADGAWGDVKLFCRTFKTRVTDGRLDNTELRKVRWRTQVCPLPIIVGPSGRD